jgi:hypothetical protein
MFKSLYRLLAVITVVLPAALSTGPARAAGDFFADFFNSPSYGGPVYSQPFGVRAPIYRHRVAIRKAAPRTQAPRHAQIWHAKVSHVARRHGVIKVARSETRAAVAKKSATPLAYAPVSRPATSPKICCSSALDAIAMIAHDKTLRPGDAYMTPEGLKVFVVTSGAKHEKRDFVTLSKASGVAPDQRASLSAMAPAKVRLTRVKQPVKTAPPTVAGTSAPAPESTIVDPRGKTIRFVGGYPTLASRPHPAIKDVTTEPSTPVTKSDDRKQPTQQANGVRPI